MKYINLLRENKILTGILILAAALRFYKLDYQSIWLDEIYTMKMADPTWKFSRLITEVNDREGFPYLYFIILKILHSIFGYTAVVARSFSALMGILSVAAMYKFGKLLFNKNTGLIAASLVCLSEFCIFTSQDARPYSFYFFSTILSFYFLVKLLKEITFKNTVIYGLACGLMLNTNFFSLVNLFSQYIIIAGLFCISDKQTRFTLFKHAVISGTIALLLFLPNYRIFVKLIGFESGWIPAPTNDSLTVVFKELMGNSEATLFIFMPIFFFYLLEIFKIAEIKKTFTAVVFDKKIFSFLVLAIWSTVLVGVIYLKSFGDTSIMIARYFVSILPVFILVIAGGISMINNTIIKTLVIGTLCFFMFSNLIVAKKYYKAKIKTQFREAANFVMDNDTNQEKINTSLKYFFDYFFEGKTLTLVEEKPSLEDLMNEMMADSTKIRNIWYVDAHNHPFKLSEKALAFSEKIFFVDKSYDGLDAWARHFVVKGNKIPTTSVSGLEAYKDKMKFWIEKLEYTGDKLTVSGWGFLEGISAENSKIDVLLIKDGTAIEMYTKNSSRNDVTQVENNGLNLDNSGFEVTTDTKNVASGNYTIALRIVNTKEHKKSVTITEKKINIPN